jgi:GMP synthase (glutamine-hydrolysing)
MPRILVFNGSPRTAEANLVAAGSASYLDLFRSALGNTGDHSRSIDFVELLVADGERLPRGTSFDDFDGVWVSGSPLNAYRLDQPSVREQIALVREMWNAGVPAFGSCWGLQMMAAALGGSVRLNPNGREIGIARTITLSEAGRQHPMYAGKPVAFDAPCIHEDEVASLPSCATVLASNEMSRVQAVAFQDGPRCFWGVQYHPEFVLSTLAAIMSTRVDRHLAEGLANSEGSVAAIVADYRALDADPQRKDLAWRYGIGADVLDPARRTIEFRNWLSEVVLPRAARR